MKTEELNLKVVAVAEPKVINKRDGSGTITISKYLCNTLSNYPEQIEIEWMDASNELHIDDEVSAVLYIRPREWNSRLYYNFRVDTLSVTKYAPVTPVPPTAEQAAQIPPIPSVQAPNTQLPF